MTYRFSRFNTKTKLYNILPQMTLMDQHVVKSELIIIIIITIIFNDLIEITEKPFEETGRTDGDGDESVTMWRR